MHARLQVFSYVLSAGVVHNFEMIDNKEAGVISVTAGTLNCNTTLYNFIQYYCMYIISCGGYCLKVAATQLILKK